MKFILKSLGFLILFIGFLLAVLLLIPDQQYKSLAEKSIHTLTDRNVSIGDLTIQRTLYPSFEFKDITLSNPDWTDNPVFIKMDQFSFSVSLLEIIKGRLTTGLSSEAATIHLTRNAKGLTNWQFTEKNAPVALQKSSNAKLLKSLTRFVLKHIKMTDFKLIFDDEQSTTHHVLTINKLDVVESEDKITQLLDIAGVLDGVPFSIKGSTGTPSEFGGTQRLPLDLKASVDNVNFLIDGALKVDTKALNLETGIQFSSPNLRLITQLTGQEMPVDWQDITGSAHLLLNAGQPSLQDIKLRMKSGLQADLSGSIGDLITLQGVDLDLTTTLATLQDLSAFTQDSLPDVGPIKFSGTIKSKNDTFLLENADLSYDDEYGRAHITGNIGNLKQLNQVNLKTDLNLPNLDVIALFSKAEMSPLGEIKLTSDLVSSGPADISANNVNLEYDHNGLKVHSSGSINSIIKNGGELNLDIDAVIDSLRALKPYVKSELPAIGPLKLRSKLSGTFSDLRVNDLELELKDDQLKGTITGDIGSITDLRNVTLNANLSSPSIGDLLNKLGYEGSATIPAKLSADVTKTDDGYKMGDFVLEMEGNKILGDIELINISNDKSRPKLTGEITVAKLNLADILKPGSKADEKTGDTPKPESGLVLSDSPLPFHFIRENDFDLTIDVEHFETGSIALSKAVIKAKSAQGKFKLESLNTRLNGGRADLEVSIDTTNEPVQASINSNINGVSFMQPEASEGVELPDNESTANASLALTGSGESIASIFASSNGDGNIYIENMVVKNEMIKFISADLLSETVGALNLVEAKHKTTAINCSAVKFDIAEGVLTTPKGYIADAEKFIITGDAKIDFKDQALDVKFYTTPKKGLGLGIGELASAIQIKGTLAQPKVGVNPGGVAEIGATIGAAIATGGLSLLAQGQYEKLKAKSKLCSKVIE